MRKIKTVLIYIMFISLTNLAFASPTSHDFKKCQKLAVSFLDYCLKGNEKSCWQRSEENHEACRIQVIKLYEEMTPQRKAEEMRIKLLNQST
ncbi:hypothetical protein [Marinomonas sp. MED121]|uniref:hypothetical protein n=1 Tax=Marinomonas sp. MED121 TaxID=314277 RepID=UPI000569C920|nr:hypothetical protein [Marinomonas sp. MED121]